MPKHLQIRYKPNGYNRFVLWCVSGSKAPLPCVWNEERFYTAGPVPRNGAGNLANGKPCVSMSLNWNEFTIPTHVTFLVLTRTLYKCMFDATNQLATRIICTKCTLNHG